MKKSAMWCMKSAKLTALKFKSHILAIRNKWLMKFLERTDDMLIEKINKNVSNFFAHLCLKNVE